MATENSTFNSEKVLKIMKDLEEKFNDFSDTLSETNTLIEKKIQHGGDNSAIKGNVGGRLSKLWEENSSNFNAFRDNFEVWAQTIALIYQNDINFEVAANTIYRNN